MKHVKPAPAVPSAVSILEQARVSDPLTPEQLKAFPAELRKLAKACRSEGRDVVRVTWPSGQLAVIPCPPGSIWPDPNDVVRAYDLCTQLRSTGKKWGLA